VRKILFSFRHSRWRYSIKVIEKVERKRKSNLLGKGGDYWKNIKSEYSNRKKNG
jgi:hypothetical protein